MAKPFQSLPDGQVAERFKAAVLKTAEVQASVGSNPTLSANCKRTSQPFATS